MIFADTFSNNFEPHVLHAAGGCLRRPATASRRMARDRRAGAVMRAHVPGDRAGRPGAERGDTPVARAVAVRGAWRADRRPRAVLPVLAARRDLALGLGPEAEAVAANAFLFEEFLAREKKAGRLDLPLQPLPEKTAYLHGHCHQKAFGAMSAVQETLGLVPDLAVTAIESSCCGMAGSFGYERATRPRSPWRNCR